MQQYQDLLIDALLDQGFSLPEAERLIALQNTLEYEIKRRRKQQEFDLWFDRNQKEPKSTN